LRLVTSGEARELDLEAQKLGVAGIALMEAAASKAAYVALAMLEDSRRQRVVVLAGRGNNGGDGLAMARHLRNAGAMVKVYLCGHSSGLPSEAAANLAAWTAAGGHCAVADAGSSFWEDLQHDLRSWADLAVDALLGAGQTRPPQGDIHRAVEILKSISISISISAESATTPQTVLRVLSLDVPTGVDADTGVAFEPHVRADVTVTFGLPKVGLLSMRGAEAAGDVYVADIGLPGVDRTAPLLPGQTGLFTAADAREVLPPRRRHSHKGDAGAAGLIGGSTGMTGAAVLMAQAAVLGGAGLVTLAVPEDVQPTVAAALREAMTSALPAPDSTSTSGTQALDSALELAARCDALAIGPGMGRAPATIQFVRHFVDACPVPLVLDADGLNAFEGRAAALAGRGSAAPLVITPHPGELARLAGSTVQEIQCDRLAAARAAAASTHAICLLKGQGTVIAAPDGTAYLVSAGNPGMATGGMGDVLTGLLAALLAQSAGHHSSPQQLLLRTVAAGALMHAVAGDMAAQEIGGIGLRAGDVAERLPRARRAIVQFRPPVQRLGARSSTAPPDPLAVSLFGVKGIV
jgi:NAD(P)H-hydrate epimerase